MHKLEGEKNLYSDVKKEVGCISSFSTMIPSTT